MLEPGADRELTLAAVHPGVMTDEVREATGWELRVAPGLTTTADPTREELDALRELLAR